MAATKTANTFNLADMGVSRVQLIQALRDAVAPKDLAPLAPYEVRSIVRGNDVTPTSVGSVRGAYIGVDFDGTEANMDKYVAAHGEETARTAIQGLLKNNNR